MYAHRNQEFQQLDRVSQIERLGVARRSHAKLIFALECYGYNKEAIALLSAETNIYLNPKYVLRLFSKYYLLLLEQNYDLAIKLERFLKKHSQ